VAPDEAVDGIEEASDGERDQQVLCDAKIRGELGHLLLGGAQRLGDLVAVELDMLGCVSGPPLPAFRQAGPTSDWMVRELPTVSGQRAPIRAALR
jgi:hypothetical protein